MYLLPEAVPGRIRSRTSRTTSSTTVLIDASSRLLTSPDSVWNRVISGAEVRTVDLSLRCFVTLRHYFR
jgi:hypothetical protein